MGFLERLATIIRSKTDKAMDKLEDPRDTIEYAYKQHADAVHKLDRSLIEVATARTRLEMQRADLIARIDQLGEQAARATEKRARDFVTRKLALQSEVQPLSDAITDIEQREAALTALRDAMQIKTDRLDVQRHTTVAQYTVAEAQCTYDQLIGVCSDITNADDVVQKAREQIRMMEARSSAIQELTDKGVFQDGVESPSEQAIDDELERLRGPKKEPE